MYKKYTTSLPFFGSRKTSWDVPANKIKLQWHISSSRQTAKRVIRRSWFRDKWREGISGPWRGCFLWRTLFPFFIIFHRLSLDQPQLLAAAVDDDDDDDDLLINTLELLLPSQENVLIISLFNIRQWFIFCTTYPPISNAITENIHRTLGEVSLYSWSPVSQV